MKRQPPGTLWVGLIALGAISVVQLGMGLMAANLPLLAGVTLNLVLLWGLHRGARWAYILTLVFCLLALVVSLTHGAAGGLLGFVLNALVFVPVLLSTRYFWDNATDGEDAAPRYCTRCGRDLQGATVVECPQCGAPFGRSQPQT